jgi:hypothetical protein
VKTDDYRRIRALVSNARLQHGLVEGGTPKATDPFVVSIPRSLHEALEREAADEGVSLNQLVVAKLAVGLGRLTDIVTKAG